MRISVIIPTLNEAINIPRLIKYLLLDNSAHLIREIIVVDGGSDDHTCTLAQSLGAKVLVTDLRNRAKQMNLGAEEAEGDVLYFLHADTFPPPDFAAKICQAIQKGYNCGCFRLKFDWNHWFLKFNSWFTRFNWNALRFGDQSLFVRKELFNCSKGFKETMFLFEDQDIIHRLSRLSRFKVLSGYVLTSARKYRKNGPYRLQLAYFVVYLFYFLGYPQRRLVDIYLSMVPFPRV